MKLFSATILFLSFITTAYSQSSSHSDGHSHHSHAANLFAYTVSYGVMESNHSDSNSDGLMYSIHYAVPSNEKLFNFDYDYTLGLHYMNNEAPHAGIMAGILLNVAENTQLGIMPTYSYYKHHHSPMHSGGMAMMMSSQDEWNSELGVHCELMFQAKLFHQEINPVITYGHSKDHTHYSIGLHFHL